MYALQVFLSWRQQRWFLWTLFVINFLGTVYGYYWYGNQMQQTDWKLLIFVPDSPTASLFFTVVIFLYLLNKKSLLLEAFAAITLFKYGIWAVVMILWGAALDSNGFISSLTWEHYMLMFSHLGMAVQALLYAPIFRFGYRQLAIVSIWTLLNDALDYGLDIHPWLTPELEVYDHLVGWFTLILSFTTIFLFSIFIEKRKANKTSNFET
ncbi:DUF1405 domain-containing protein [Shimazuella sp. AN120528]|uniref:DUF1405 domain-containing protein n=1 Tax=Shimazuella soli TaxID=1892854 RepID=UPI001F0F6D39|nr:DUF1405 domain-containing protein [Shimazuella soli]MCH5585464.1 DUF1405 domain-containing protein [Shimazuella soli]